MKTFLTLLSILIIAACDVSTGPVGPPGPVGADGADGFIGQGFQKEVDFTPSNGFTKIIAFPDNIEVFDTDIVVAYLRFEVDQETGNEVWQQLPASFFFNDGGELQYSFDHTLADIRLFLQGDIDFNTLGPEYTQNQIFRVAILPVDYVNSTNLDLKNMDEVMQVVGKNNFKRMKIK